MGRPLARLFGAFALLLVLLLLSTLFLVLHQGPPPLPPLPRPNGYDDFIQAGRLVNPPASDYATMSHTELSQVISTNGQALALVRTGLTHRCQVALPLSITNTVRPQNLASLKRLAQLLTAQGRLAQLENRPANAAEAYVTTIRLGQELGRGGLVIDSLVGVAVEAMGLTYLERLLPSLGTEVCRNLAAVLEELDANREPMERFIENDSRSARATYGWKFEYYRLVEFRAYTQSLKRYRARYSTIQQRERLLMLALAGRAYELDKGQRPQNPAQLVPVYLKIIPQDPLTGSNFVFAP